MYVYFSTSLPDFIFMFFLTFFTTYFQSLSAKTSINLSNLLKNARIGCPTPNILFLSLSYSSINNYFECGFKYYLSNILNLGEDKEIRSAKIGSVYHKILELSKEKIDVKKSKS